MSQYSEWYEWKMRTDPEFYRDHCKKLQARLRCPNCGTIWECRCTVAEQQAACRRAEARRQADYARRVREVDEQIAAAQAAWEKRYGHTVPAR